MTATTSWFTILCEQAVSAWPRHSDEWYDDCNHCVHAHATTTGSATWLV